MDDGATRIRTFVRANLPLVAVPGLSAIRLHRAGPASGLWRLEQVGKRDVGPPYWAYPWPGGVCLAHHVLRRPGVVRGKRVLDLGAGGGLVAIAAAKAGADAVFAAEVNPFARVALQLNAKANDVRLEVIADDVMAGSPPAVDIVLVGDLYYAAPLARRVTIFLRRCREAHIKVHVGDIGRAFLPPEGLRRVATYPVADVGDSGLPAKRGTVYAFEG